ncbi:MAG: ATP-dependent DNA helicase [Kofleriaceae bacterium]
MTDLVDGGAVASALAPGGLLAQTIPHYEDRPEQRAMSAAVARALADDRPLLVEAGTGTGKTLAYLVPALASGKRVVISTGTRTLQDQLARHDLPLLRALSPRPFTAVVLKGVANYACKRRLAELGRTRTDDVARALTGWADGTDTGDRAEVDWLADDDPVWAEITTTTETRVGPRCAYFERCFVTAARRAAERADLVLINHHLYFADLALRAASPGARVLPDHDAIIFDEAHQLEDIATEHFGARVSTARLAGLVRDAHAALGGTLFDGGAAELVLAVERASHGLLARVRTALLASRPEGDGATRVPLPPGLLAGGDTQAAWFRLDAALEELARAADDAGDDAPADAEVADDGVRAARRHLARRARDVRDDLAALAEQHQPSHVYWGALRPSATALMASPLAVGDLIRRRIVHGGPTAIFTSATLTAAGSFDYARTRLGLDRELVDELAVPSPFDYGEQALLYLPRDLPAPPAPGFGPAAVARIRELLAITSGRAFVLFTSHRALAEAARALTGTVPYPLLIQGQAPRATLVDRFRATPGAVLLGTGGFWEGVDVAGDALSLVVIDKLPFSPHTDPLTAARMARHAELGDDPFTTLQLPAAAIALRQGFGRLIRRRDDRGIVAVLDPRVVTKNYGQVFLASLPTGLPRTSALEQVRRWWQPRAPGAST